MLGKQFAAARNAEEKRLARGNPNPSPLGSNVHYKVHDGDFDLSNPRRLDVDDQLEQVCRRYAGSDGNARAVMRISSSMDDFYTLLVFARRASVFAMREKHSSHVRDGLATIAMIEPARVDYRDVLVALSMLYSAAIRNGDNADGLIRDAATLAGPSMSELMSSFVNRSPESKDLRCMGSTIVETEAGPGLVEWGGRSYRPTLPLDRIALRLSGFVRADKYQPTVTLATELPKVWLAGVDDATLSGALQSIVAAATVNGKLRPDESPEHQYQQWTLFVVELASDSAAQTLDKLAREKVHRKNNCPMLALQSGRLFVVVIARSVVAGKDAFESPSSLARFAPGIMEILKACTDS